MRLRREVRWRWHAQRTGRVPEGDAAGFGLYVLWALRHGLSDGRAHGARRGREPGGLRGGRRRIHYRPESYLPRRAGLSPGTT